MVKKNSIKLFGDDKIRAIWDDDQEKWYFSIVDVIAVLTESPNPQTYWRVLKKRVRVRGKKRWGFFPKRRIQAVLIFLQSIFLGDFLLSDYSSVLFTQTL